MKILELELKNFEGVYAAMQVRHLYLNLRESKNPICLITGPNGCGKTVLLSNLHPFATLGSMDERDSMQLITQRRHGYKKVIIKKDNSEYLIEHFYSPSKDTHTIKSYIKKDGEELNQNGNVTSFKAVVSDELDIEQEFMKLVRLGNNVTNLIDLKSSERKTFMSKILEDTNVYLKHFKKINTETNTLKTLIKNVVDKLDKLHKSSGIMDADEGDEKLHILKRDLDNSRDKIQRYQEDMKVIEYRLTQIPKDNCKVLQESTAALKKLDKKRDKMVSLDELIQDIKDTEAKICELTDQYELYYRLVRENLDILDRDKNLLDDTQCKLSKVESSSDIDGLIRIIKSLEETIKNEENLYKEYGKIPYTKADIEEVIIFLKEKQAIFDRMYEFGREPIKKVVELMLEEVDINSYITENVEKLANDNLISGGKRLVKKIMDAYGKRLFKKSSCEDCPYVDLAEEMREIANTPDNINEISEEFYSYMGMVYSTIKTVLLSFPERKELFSKIPDYLKEYLVTENILRKLTTLDKIYDQEVFFTELGFINDYEEYLHHKEELDQRNAEYNRLIRDSSVELLKEQKESLEECIKKTERKIHQFRKTMDEKDVQRTECMERFKDLKELKDIVERREELIVAKEKASELYDLQNSLTKQLNDMKQLYLGEKLREERMSKEINTLSYTIKQMRVYNKELSVYQKYYDKWILMKDSLSTNDGIPLVFIDMYMKRCKGLINSLLDAIYDGKMYITKFNISQNEFTIPFFKNGKENADIRYASQGEKSFFSITTSFAINAESMSSYNIMLLDELDSVLDETNRANFVAVIEKIREIINAEQMFNISHNNMFSAYPVDIISVINKKPENHPLANFIPIILDNNES